MAGTDRRTALISLAGAAIVTPVFALTACKKGGEEGEVTANEDLMREHGVLRRILVVYREVAPRLMANPATVDAAALASAAKLFQRFGERYHEQLLEEQHIFPVIRKAGGDGARLAEILTNQHRRGREITGYVLDRTRTGKIGTGDSDPLAQSLLAFCRMYEAHAAREDTVIFPAFKKALGEKGYDELGDQFEEIEKREFGGDGFDMALKQVEQIEQALGASDLDAFTAPSSTVPAEARADRSGDPTSPELHFPL